MTIQSPIVVNNVPTRKRKPTPHELIAFAIKQAGTQKNLARLIGMSQQQVSHALIRGEASARMAVMIERVSRGRVKAIDICPALTKGEFTDYE